MQSNFYKRLAQVESMANAQKSELEEVLRSAYDKACEAHNKEDAAYFARKLRNKLLDQSDKEMSLDRLGLDASSATKFIASLATIFTGSWAKYRQALRDIPEQLGFPFDIDFPAPPDEHAEEGDA